MQKAIALAKKGTNDSQGSPFGSIIVKNDQIVSRAFNKVKAANDCSQHAEVVAIQEACKILESSTLKGCVLYTSCEPCMMCLGTVYWAKLDAVYYGASALDAKKYGFVYSDLYYQMNAEQRHSRFSMQQLLREEAVSVWK